MQFFIALGILVLASSAYLVHQFLRRTLAPGDARLTESNAEDPQENHLKAA